jgi:hypothetical protein
MSREAVRYYKRHSSAARLDAAYEAIKAVHPVASSHSTAEKDLKSYDLPRLPRSDQALPPMQQPSRVRPNASAWTWEGKPSIVPLVPRRSTTLKAGSSHAVVATAAFSAMTFTARVIAQ